MSTTGKEVSTITVERGTFEDAKSLKRGGESWTSLIRKMAEQYDPEASG